jgi:hypothetical protein
MRAQMCVVRPDEDAAEFAALEAALLDELAPVGALQVVLARRVAIAAWRLARADRMEIELFEQRRWDNGSVGTALIRDGNGTRSFETLMRYRGAAMGEFWRALRTLKALQPEQAAEVPMAAQAPARAKHSRLAARPDSAAILAPNEPEGGPVARVERRFAYVPPDPAAPGRALHEPAAPWLPNEPEHGGDLHGSGGVR